MTATYGCEGYITSKYIKLFVYDRYELKYTF